MTTITISVRNGAIECTPKRGNLRVNPNGGITWRCNEKDQRFRLTFQLVPFEGVAEGQSDWPFQGNPPKTAPSTDWLDKEFSGTVIGDGVFKYDVETKDADGNILHLDPIIIIRN